jgi:hypothetical protein
MKRIIKLTWDLLSEGDIHADHMLIVSDIVNY